MEKSTSHAAIRTGYGACSQKDLSVHARKGGMTIHAGSWIQQQAPTIKIEGDNLALHASEDAKIHAEKSLQLQGGRVSISGGSVSVSGSTMKVKAGTVEIEAGLIQLTGNVVVVGNLAVTGLSTFSGPIVPGNITIP
jgi:phage baseplate assembly protein gpV